MDIGHYNCRDYYVSPHFAPTTIILDSPPLSPTTAKPSFLRHESFAELEQRSRSPASLKPKFPFLSLPLEIRQQIYSYLLPRTVEHRDANPLGAHIRNFPTIKRTTTAATPTPSAPTTTHPTQSPSRSRTGPTHIIWHRGQTSLLSVSRQLHAECAQLLYSSNTFLLFLTYRGITFRFSWLLASGLAPSRRYDFLALLAPRYRDLVRRVVVNVDHVDAYTGMINFNVGAAGLVHGLRGQVGRLVEALVKVGEGGNGDGGDGRIQGKKRMTRVSVYVANGNQVIEQINARRQKLVMDGQEQKAVAEMLEPMGRLRGVREVSIGGAVGDEFAEAMEAKMKSLEPVDASFDMQEKKYSLDITPGPQLCVYGNDIT